MRAPDTGREARRLIQASMRRWREHNAFGRSKGLGLSEAELLDKVARETGAAKTAIRQALKGQG